MKLLGFPSFQVVWHFMLMILFYTVLFMDLVIIDCCSRILMQCPCGPVPTTYHSIHPSVNTVFPRIEALASIFYGQFFTPVSKRGRCHVEICPFLFVSPPDTYWLAPTYRDLPPRTDTDAPYIKVASKTVPPTFVSPWGAVWYESGISLEQYWLQIWINSRYLKMRLHEHKSSSSWTFANYIYSCFGCWEQPLHIRKVTIKFYRYLE